MNRKVSFDAYLTKLSQSGFSPNFWSSREYAEKSGWDTFLINNTLLVMDEEKNIMLPAIGFDSEYYSFWAGFSELTPVDDSYSFLDYEFIYDPARFAELSGKQWHPTRKNLRWAVEDCGEYLIFADSKEQFSESRIDDFLSEWMKKEEEKEIYDPEVMIKYMYYGENRLFLSGLISHKIYAILAWDENFKYINFRYCLTLGGIRGLSDTARIFFYRFISGNHSGKLVNDGGSLGNEGLERYKKRLNPIQINSIYSRTIKKEN